MIFSLFLASAAQAAQTPKSAPPRPTAPRAITFKTSDGWLIAASYRAPRPGRAVLILAHGVASSRNEWEPFAARLAEQGVGSLALDLRGHGESRRGPNGEMDLASFDATGEWPRAVQDFAAAAAWLRARGVPAARVAFGGASIGANLASLAASKRQAAPFLLLLSPSENYHGVGLDVRPGLKTLAAASAPDGYAFAGVRALAARTPTVDALEAPAGHGVQMFADPATFDRIVAWVAKASDSLKP